MAKLLVLGVAASSVRIRSDDSPTVQVWRRCLTDSGRGVEPGPENRRGLRDGRNLSCSSVGFATKTGHPPVGSTLGLRETMAT